MEAKNHVKSGVEVVKNTLAGKPYYRLIPHGGLILDGGNDKDPDAALAHAVAECLPDGEAKRALLNPEGYGFRGVRRLKHPPKYVGGIDPQYTYDGLIETISEFGIDKRTHLPSGYGHAVWISFGHPEVAFSRAFDGRKMEAGIIMILNPSGLTDNHIEYKEHGVMSISGHPDAYMTYNERLIACVEIDWPLWQSDMAQG